jgi:hypothetical protein
MSISPDNTPVDEVTANLAKYDDFWFEDGSVVIVAQDKHFRVHQSILSRHSEVFADMFSIPQPPTQETLDGCPILKLNDELYDLVDLMKVLYHPL